MVIKREIIKIYHSIEVKRHEMEEFTKRKSNVENLLKDLNSLYPPVPIIENTTIKMNELNEVESKLTELIEKKYALANDLKRIKHQLGQLANNYQIQINQYLTHTRIDLFKQLKNGELRPDLQISYKNRPYRVLSNSEKIRCMLEIITLINNRKKQTYPIFLDNLESITHLDPPNTQIITATVKRGMPLTLKIKENQN